jgi:hypothetical protein
LKHKLFSPALILQQKKDQLGHLEERIKQQTRNVEGLQEQTWVKFTIYNSTTLWDENIPHFAIYSLLPYSSEKYKCFSKKERQDIEDLEVPETKRLFLKQNSFESQKTKEEKEYLDAINKEVTQWIKSDINKIVVT